MANFIRCIITKSPNVRNFTRTPVRLDNAKLTAGSHRVNNLEKRFLVWTGKFKHVNDVPAMVPGEMVEKARNRMRIRIANIMMAVTLLACLVVSISGKRKRDRGESLLQQNIEWHKRVKEEDQKEKAKQI